MTKLTALEAFYAAFNRLKEDAPLVVPRGTAVSQNNVAREAGCDPSALRKSRYPDLIEDIKCFILESSKSQPVSTTRQKLKQRLANRSLRYEIDALKSERDLAMSLLLEADSRILELFVENERLRAHQPKANILPMR
ncbi:hypothetical protein [Pseudomonas canadensis]|uniref:hypothetical protein n=1 Tax=Pseudomonas canadensis TaxID=915099 RepID=UPI0027328B87|nr:hypothetical protein [Pseudomonas canadensis]WLH29937.1 hypothetical protein PSH56_28575 [Pseudomonas canadensis]